MLQGEQGMVHLVAEHLWVPCVLREPASVPGATSAKPD
jgi:hypothetical protein